MLGEVVFPNADDAPAEFAQLTVYAEIPRLVRGKFLFPKGTIASGDFAMFWATVPETAVHKERQAVPPKKKIRPAENILPPAPAGDAVTTK